MKILIAYASAGAGHMKAAEAVAQRLRREPELDVTLLDVLEQSSPLFQKSYAQVYTFFVSKVPFVWKFLFILADIPWLQGLIRLLRRAQNSLNTRKFQKNLETGRYDVLISTHFMPHEVAGALKRKGRIQTRIVVVVTDFDVHRIWLNDQVDQYCVATGWTRDKLTSLRVNPGNIIETGIPTLPEFAAEKDVAGLHARLKLKDDFTALMATGSFGIGPIEEVLDALRDVQVIVICGHNAGLYERLKAHASERVKVFSLVDNMYEMMAASDVMITKPGGLSISEALVSRLPMIFFSAIPGQEEGNIRVLAEHNVGYRGGSVQEICERVTFYKNHPAELDKAKAAAGELAHPDAVDAIRNLI